jgi:hypothetical protein
MLKLSLGHGPQLVTVAELILVSCAGRTGKTAIATHGKTGQNYFRIYSSKTCAEVYTKN